MNVMKSVYSMLVKMITLLPKVAEILVKLFSSLKDLLNLAFNVVSATILGMNKKKGKHVK